MPLGDAPEAGSRVVEAVVRGGQWEVVCSSSGVQQWTDLVADKVVAVGGSMHFAAVAFEAATLQVSFSLSGSHLSCLGCRDSGAESINAIQDTYKWHGIYLCLSCSACLPKLPNLTLRACRPANESQLKAIVSCIFSGHSHMLSRRFSTHKACSNPVRYCNPGNKEAASIDLCALLASK